MPALLGLRRTLGVMLGVPDPEAPPPLHPVRRLAALLVLTLLAAAGWWIGTTLR